MNWIPKAGEKVKAHNEAIKKPHTLAIYIGAIRDAVYSHVTSVNGKKVKFKFVEKL